MYKYIISYYLSIQKKKKNLFVKFIIHAKEFRFRGKNLEGARTNKFTTKSNSVLQISWRWKDIQRISIVRIYDIIYNICL